MTRRPALMLALTLFVLVVTSAPSRAAVVRAGNYYEDTAYLNCPATTSFCNLVFTATPADKFLTVTTINCANFIRNTTLVQGYFGLEAAARFRYFPPGTPVAQGTDNTYFFNADIIFKVGKSKILNFRTTAVGVHTGSNITCTFTGELSDG